jgi:hypothetical protein
MGVGLACLPLTAAGAAPAAATQPSFSGSGDPSLERWLLSTGRSHIEAPVYDLVANRIR